MGSDTLTSATSCLGSSISRDSLYDEYEGGRPSSLDVWIDSMGDTVDVEA